MDEKTNYYFIVNKWAGARHSVQTWDKLHQYLLQNEVQFERAVTEYPKHATELAQKFADGHPTNWVIVALGGDGTLLEVLNGVQRSKNKIPIGYIPAGSGNDFARAVGLARDPYQALQQLIQTTAPIELDVEYIRIRIIKLSTILAITLASVLMRAWCIRLTVVRNSSSASGIWSRQRTLQRF